MHPPNTLPLLCLLVSCGLLQGCSTPPASAVDTTAPLVIQKAAQKSAHEGEPRVKTIKPGTPTSKSTGKLTPEEVEDIIRKLSVCKPH